MDLDPPSRAARVSYLNGAVSFQASGSTDWSLAALNYSVTSGDRLFADQGAQAELDISSVMARLAERTDVTLARLDDHYAQFALAVCGAQSGVAEGFVAEPWPCAWRPPN